MELSLILFLPSFALTQVIPAPQDGVIYHDNVTFFSHSSQFHFQPPPGLGGVQQSVQALTWRNANCGGTYTGEVIIIIIKFNCDLVVVQLSWDESFRDVSLR